jgi:GMP synthase-like glutamine amidotransferase
MLGGIAWDHPAMCTHGQEVKKLPAGAMLLGSSKMCKNHIYKMGLRTYAFQSHPECDRAMVEAYWKNDPMASRAGVTADDLRQQTEKHYAEYARLSDRLAVNLANFAFPILKKLSA